MNYKFEVGDLVLLERPRVVFPGAIFHITQRDCTRLEDDIIPHNYYEGYAMALEKNKTSGLYVPIGFPFMLRQNNKENWLSQINSKKVYLEKLFKVVDIPKL